MKQNFLLLLILSSLCLAQLRVDFGDGVKGSIESQGYRVSVESWWNVIYSGGDRLPAADFKGKVNVSKDGVQYRSDELDFDIAAVAAEQGIDFRVTILKTSRHIEQFLFPHQADFPVEGMRKFVFPTQGNSTHGLALLPTYFAEHDLKGGSHKWRSVVMGTKGYEMLFGGRLNQLPDRVDQKQLKVTEAGREWFQGDAIRGIEVSEYSVNRPPAEGQADVVLVETEDGPALAGSRLGGEGWLFRFTGYGNDRYADYGQSAMRRMFVATMNAVVYREPKRLEGKKAILIALKNGPIKGNWSPMYIERFEEFFRSASFLGTANATYEVVDSPEGMRRALSDPQVGLIVNPYGEGFPSGETEKFLGDLELVRNFVRRGGVWWELAGYPFYCVLVPRSLNDKLIAVYPSAVADFAHVSHSGGGIAIYGIQPMMRKPWDLERLVKPAMLHLEATGTAARFTHGWMMAVKQGDTWQSPPFRWATDQGDPRTSLANYAKLNEIQGSLEQKVTKPGVLDKLKGAVLVKLFSYGSKHQIATLDHLPKGSLVHYSSYLKGGFDKEYPDHLPVNPKWGTNDDLARLINRSHELGHLIMPYTNTSWWCTDPRGPTFEREGEEPLGRNLDGSLKKERYAKNEGFSLCFYHPAVQAAHRKVRHQMTVEFPNDVLFQDQVGARRWTWNFHPLEPNPASGYDGMHSLSMEDAKTVPMATEDGHDRVLNFETMICGAAWSMIPSFGNRRSHHIMYNYPAGDWQFYPILSYLGHDQVIFTTHDLGHFMRKPINVAYAIACGYAMSAAWHHDDANNQDLVNWIFWLDAVQKSICKDYAGKKLIDFRYLQEGTSQPAPHNAIYAEYDGDIKLVVNIGERPLELKGLLDSTKFSSVERAWLESKPLPEFGFYAMSPRIRTARVFDDKQNITSIALRLENNEWIGDCLANNDATITIPMPAQLNGKTIAASTRNGVKVNLTWNIKNDIATITLPKQGKPVVDMPEVFEKTAPKNSKATTNQVVIIKPNEYKNEKFHQNCQEWIDGLKEQFAGTDLQLIVVDNLQAMSSLLTQPRSKAPFAIINYGGEITLVPQGIKHFDYIAMIKQYVDNGGIWWNTGGYPFYFMKNIAPDGTETTNPTGPIAAARLGVECPSGAIDEPEKRLFLTDTGKLWFAGPRADRIQAASANTQRPFVKPEVSLPLIQGGNDNFVAGIRFDGYGFFFNLGGFSISRDVAIDIVAGTIEYLWNNPTPTPLLHSQNFFWKLRPFPR
ncbi:MAG: hypothetical protein GX561_08370 [Lentisphaerae bacterium]|jgi:hypothetical protein|nr:hypothetical protein [Lentisphaerota bacterium]